MNTQAIKFIPFEHGKLINLYYKCDVGGQYYICMVMHEIIPYHKFKFG